jgi:hypothetical protein
MSSGSIRRIAQTFLTAPPIEGLPVVLREWDNQMELVATGQAVPLQTIACIHFANEVDRRLTTPAVTGWVMVDYSLSLQVCLLLPESSGDAIADASDDLVETVKQRLRSDPLMGRTSQFVFESAQSQTPLIRARRGDVQWLKTGSANGTPIQWISIEWTATEQVTA